MQEAAIKETHASLVKLMRMQGKTEAEAHVWADELLRRGAELGLLNKNLDLKDSN